MQIIDVAARLMGDPACANTLFAEFDLQPDCVKLFISKGLSVGIVIGATIGRCGTRCEHWCGCCIPRLLPHIAAGR